MPKSDVIISLVSVFIGSAITFAVTYFGIFKSEKFAKLEKSRERVGTALLQSSKLWTHLPATNQNYYINLVLV